jgi:hypothetical protein
VAQDARDIVALVPAGAAVSAHHAITAHLARRHQIYMFPNPFRVVLYGPTDELERARARLPEADDIEYVVLPVSPDEEMAADWDVVKGEFEVVARNDSWVLYKRLSSP